LLLLEAVTADLVFTISLKRSTQNLQLSTSSPADYPICCDPVLAKPDRLARPPRPPPPRRRRPPALAAVDQVKKKSTAARPKARAGFAAALAREEAHKQQLTRPL
jgi:hypothetical protein